MSNIVGWQYRVLLQGAPSFIETVSVQDNYTAKTILENKYPGASQITPVGPVTN